MAKKLKVWGVLTALKTMPLCINGRTIYIRDKLRAQGYNVSGAILLRHLRVLEKEGYVTCDGILHGFYGYEWTVTEKGMAFP